MIKFHEDPIECKNELISAALSAGGYDNVTIALANIQTDEEPEEEPEAEEEKEEKDEEKAEEEENLSTTVRSDIIGHRAKKGKVRFFLILLLLIIIGCTVYLWLAKDSDPVKQAFMTTVIPYWDKLMSYVK
jgi:hypothetical protein